MKRPTRKSRAGRRPSRPEHDSREAILAAARRCFSRTGYRATTLRSIAEAAGVTPAMLHYYFGDKAGLYLAVVKSAAEPLLHELQQLRDTGPGQAGIARLFEVYMRTVAAHPEMPALLMHDVLSADGPMRATFASQFAARGREALSTLLLDAQRNGDIGAALDIDLTCISLLSLAIFPFFAAPLIRQVFGIDWDDEQLEALIRHQQRLFLQGATARETGE